MCAGSFTSRVRYRQNQTSSFRKPPARRPSIPILKMNVILPTHHREVSICEGLSLTPACALSRCSEGRRPSVFQPKGSRSRTLGPNDTSPLGIEEECRFSSCIVVSRWPDPGPFCEPQSDKHFENMSISLPAPARTENSSRRERGRRSAVAPRPRGSSGK